MDGNLTPLQRFFLAFVAFFYVLFNRRFAEEVNLLRERERAALPPAGGSRTLPDAPGRSSAAAATISVPSPTASEAGGGTTAVPRAAEGGQAVPKAEPLSGDAVAMHVLAILQRDGRLIDFLSEDLGGFSDSEIGAAARTVHDGCRKALASYVALEPVFRDPEGATVTVSPGFDPATIRLTGNVVGAPPFKGSLRHHGWRAVRASFPPVPPNHDPRILAPAEVEL